MGESVYKVIELVGTSPNSWEEAARNAVETASKSLKDLRVAEITIGASCRLGVESAESASASAPAVRGRAVRAAVNARQYLFTNTPVHSESENDHFGLAGHRRWMLAGQ